MTTPARDAMRSGREALARAWRLLAARGARAALLLAALALASGPARAQSTPTVDEYRVQAGDTLLIAAAGIPEFNHRVTVGVDGQLIIPLAGRVAAAGRTVPEILATVQRNLSTKVFRRRSEMGGEVPIVIGPDEVTINVAEYRQIYVNGDVSRPGEQPFRPGITVRAAVAVAGGYDLARFRMSNPITELADLRSQHDTLWAQHAQAHANVLRLEAELAGKTSFDDKALRGGPIPADLVRQIVELESQHLLVRNADIQKEKVYLQGAIKQESGRAQTLSEQQRQEQEGAREDVEELARMRDLLAKGSVPSTRITDARRSLLLSSTRTLQTGAQLAQVERERGNLGRKLEQVDDQRRMALLRELQDARVKLAGLQADLGAVNEKLQYTGLIRSQLVRGGGSKPAIVIVRQSGTGYQRIEAGEDSPLLPGDIAEVSLQSELQARASR